MSWMEMLRFRLLIVILVPLAPPGAEGPLEEEEVPRRSKIVPLAWLTSGGEREEMRESVCVSRARSCRGPICFLETMSGGEGWAITRLEGRWTIGFFEKWNVD
jgi:hypothetical protein